jgi:HemY protein
MRGLVALFGIAALIAAAVFLADHPGRVEIVWQGWLIETSVGVLAAAASLALVLVIAIVRLLGLILGAPRRFVRSRRERRRRAGYRALTQGMLAVAAGDRTEAQRHAHKADLLLADPPLTLLLSAQAAQLDGDTAAAKKFYTAMLERPETEFLGLRELIAEAVREGDAATALHLAERARKLRPTTPWVIERLFELQVRERRWEAARDTLAEAEKRHVVPRVRAGHHRGVILHELSLAAAGEGRRQQALQLAARAVPLTPDLPTPAAHHARLLLQEGRARQAAKAVERAWQTLPHPELARAWRAIHAEEPPLGRVKCFERLVAQNPAARESHLAQAEAALDAQLWGEARRHLDAALAAPPPATAAGQTPPAGIPTPRLCLLVARLAEAEPGAPGPLRAWLGSAAGASPDPCWVCAHCGGESLDWSALCPLCGGFDGLAWHTPARAIAAAAPSAAASAVPPPRLAELPAAADG